MAVGWAVGARAGRGWVVAAKAEVRKGEVAATRAVDLAPVTALQWRSCAGRRWNQTRWW